MIIRTWIFQTIKLDWDVIRDADLLHTLQFCSFQAYPVTMNSPKLIQNPILPGFNPDPSILRVGEDFYIATSTFEWFPGVRVYHSRDLRHWRLIATPLDRLSMLDMRGEAASCGVWAPCLTHDGNQFYLVYSNTRSMLGPYWDVSNYVVTAPEITGPWSEPVFLNRSGFDPSMFHAPDGRKWVLNMIQDPRPGHDRFAGIELTEYDPSAKKLTGTPKVIFYEPELHATEGPHLYFRNGWYYLMLAEGGTSWDHAVTLARSKAIVGPYELDPEYPTISARGTDAVLQKAGHGSLVDTPDGKEWYIAHLCGRPVIDGENRRCILGRETAIQKVVWTDDGWLRLAESGCTPFVEVPSPDLPDHPFAPPDETIHFNTSNLHPELQTLREPPSEEWLSLTERPGWLRLYGRYSLCCPYEQSLVGRRIQHFTCTAETRLDFEPDHYLQTAGLAAFYDDQHWFYLQVSHDRELGRVLRLVVNEQHKLREPLAPMALPPGPVRLGADLQAPGLRFRYAPEGGEWTTLPAELDATLLSDDVGARYRFTGAFFVLCAQNAAKNQIPADFENFTVLSRDEN
jgi:xylan 1,4-beta-xylosidase